MLRALYELAVGPLAWLAFAVFALGSAWRLAVLARPLFASRPPALGGFRPGWALASLLRWLLPLNATARNSPVTIALFFVFHVSFLSLGFFALGHVVLLDMNLGLSWWTLPGAAADALAVACLGAAGFFAARRLLLARVRMLTGRGDWLALGLAVAPVLTGLLAHWQLGPYRLMIVLHVLSGEALLAALPFTRLSHAYLFFASRVVTGSDFGKRGVGAW